MLQCAKEKARRRPARNSRSRSSLFQFQITGSGCFGLFATDHTSRVDDAGEVAQDGKDEAHAELETAPESPPNPKRGDEVCAQGRDNEVAHPDAAHRWRCQEGWLGINARALLRSGAVQGATVKSPEPKMA